MSQGKISIIMEGVQVISDDEFADDLSVSSVGTELPPSHRSRRQSQVKFINVVKTVLRANSFAHLAQRAKRSKFLERRMQPGGRKSSAILTGVVVSDTDSGSSDIDINHLADSGQFSTPRDPYGISELGGRMSRHGSSTALNLDVEPVYAIPEVPSGTLGGGSFFTEVERDEPCLGDGVVGLSRYDRYAVRVGGLPTTQRRARNNNNHHLVHHHKKEETCLSSSSDPSSEFETYELTVRGGGQTRTIQRRRRKQYKSTTIIAPRFSTTAAPRKSQLEASQQKGMVDRLYKPKFVKDIKTHNKTATEMAPPTSHKPQASSPRAGKTSVRATASGRKKAKGGKHLARATVSRPTALRSSARRSRPSSSRSTTSTVSKKSTATAPGTTRKQLLPVLNTADTADSSSSSGETRWQQQSAIAARANAALGWSNTYAMSPVKQPAVKKKKKRRPSTSKGQGRGTELSNNAAAVGTAAPANKGSRPTPLPRTHKKTKTPVGRAKGNQGAAETMEDAIFRDVWKGRHERRAREAQRSDGVDSGSPQSSRRMSGQDQRKDTGTTLDNPASSPGRGNGDGQGTESPSERPVPHVSFCDILAENGKQGRDYDAAPPKRDHSSPRSPGRQPKLSPSGGRKLRAHTIVGQPHGGSNGRSPNKRSGRKRRVSLQPHMEANLLGMIADSPSTRRAGIRSQPPSDDESDSSSAPPPATAARLLGQEGGRERFLSREELMTPSPVLRHRRASVGDDTDPLPKRKGNHRRNKSQVTEMRRQAMLEAEESEGVVDMDRFRLRLARQELGASPRTPGSNIDIPDRPASPVVFRTPGRPERAQVDVARQQWQHMEYSSQRRDIKSKSANMELMSGRYQNLPKTKIK